jgi:hypothetical protein
MQSIPILDITFKAGADLSAYRYAPVKLGANANEVLLAGAGDEVIGILQNEPGNGEAAAVRIAGTSLVKAAGAITKGAAVVANGAIADGKVTTAGAGHTHTENTAAAYVQNATTSSPNAASVVQIIGRLLQATAADGDLVEMYLNPQRW